MIAATLLLAALQDPATPSVDQQVAAAAEHVAAAVDDFLGSRRSRMKRYASKDDRLVLWTDFPARDAKKALERSTGILGRLDASLGAPEDPATAQLRAVMVKRGKSYEALCEAVAEADPAQAGFMASSAETTGFTLYRPPVTVYFHDPKVQAEARPDHSVAHNLVHLELTRRFGQLPLWLKEGLACAGEEGAYGEVWAPWYRDGFVYAKSHGAWRDQCRERAPGLAGRLERLFRYTARPYEDDLAHDGFAFATWALEEQPAGLAAFLERLRGEYAANQKEGGRFQPDPAKVLDFAAASFGADWRERLEAWWSPEQDRGKKSKQGR